MTKKFIHLIMGTCILTASLSAFAENKFEFAPRAYLGADAQMRHMNFKKGFGDNLFSHDYPQLNVYVGFKPYDYVGIEAGFETTKVKKRTVFVARGVTHLGTPVDDNEFHTGTSKIKGPHVNIVGFLPISESYKLALLGSVGVARLKLTLKDVTQVAGSQRLITLKLVNRKTVLRATGGIQHMVTDYVGVKATVAWENTAKFNNVRNPRNIDIAKAKDSIIYGLGVFVYL